MADVILTPFCVAGDVITISGKIRSRCKFDHYCAVRLRATEFPSNPAPGTSVGRGLIPPRGGGTHATAREGGAQDQPLYVRCCD